MDSLKRDIQYLTKQRAKVSGKIRFLMEVRDKAEKGIEKAQVDLEYASNSLVETNRKIEPLEQELLDVSEQLKRLEEEMDEFKKGMNLPME